MEEPGVIDTAGGVKNRVRTQWRQVDRRKWIQNSICTIECRVDSGCVCVCVYMYNMISLLKNIMHFNGETSDI